MRKLIWLCVLALTGTGFAQDVAPRAVTVEDVWKDFRFYAAGAGGIRWMKDDNYYSKYDEEKNIIRVNVNNEEDTKVILSNEKLTSEKLPMELAGDAYSFSPDEQKVLFKHNHQPIYRRSATDACWVYDMKTDEAIAIYDVADIMYPTFSPQSDKLAFVIGNNLAVQDLESDEEWPIVEITEDGEQNSIINGATDWVYEEEFAFTRAFQWSPNGQYIAYYRFDESEVKEFNMSMYNGLYPNLYTFKYPKAGEDNAIVTLHIYDVKSGKKVTVDTGKEIDIYFPRIWWTPGNKLVISRLNRNQNHLELLLADPANGKTRLMLEEKSDTYISEIANDKIVFLKDGKRYLFQSEKDGYHHLYLRELDSDKEIQLTSGKWDVTTFYGIDEKNNLAYYRSSEISPVESHVFSVRLDGKKKKQLTSGSGTHSADFSSNFSYYIHNFSSVDTPPIITLKSAKGKEIRVLQDNADLKERINGFKTSKKEFFTFQTEDGTSLNGWMMKPLDFDASKEYPVLMYNYSGPGSQSVTNSYDGLNYWWYQHLCSQGYLIACVDPRGTGSRGVEFKKVTYQQLGKYETEDLRSAARYLGNLPFIDSKRIGIWGWSYGGYMSSLCITKGAPEFRAAIAVAPVTNWRFYDTIYTERYMRTPQENADGYDDNSPINHVDKLEGSYLIVHGMADDNVHMQNAAEMVNALVDANKDFEMFLYPNKNHSIFGGYTRLHLYRLMTDFLDRKLMN